MIQKEKSMSLLLRPMIWDEFIGSMIALQIKYCFPSFPQSRPQMHITTFPNGTGHLSALRRAEWVARMGGHYVQFQQKAALGQADMPWRKCLNPDASVGCQAIFSALIQNGADASAEGTSAKWNVGN